MKLIKLFSAVIFFFFIQGCASLFVTGSPEFIKVNGIHLELSGKPYYFAGANMWYGCYISAEGKTGDRERLIRELDRLQSIGITNLRILGASEKSYFKTEVEPAIQIKPGVYNEDILKGLDFLLMEMHKRNMHAVIYLNNFWNWSGGMAEYNTWSENGKGVQESGDDYDPVMDYTATFYGNQKAQELYIHYVYSIVTRKNTYTGINYNEDPTIMAWQLANEPRPGRNTFWLDEYYRWIETTAQFIHNIDHNHLVSTGSEGTIGSLQDSTIFFNAHKTKYIDYLTFHLWPKNWGWYNAKESQQTYPSALKKAVNYINDQIELARQLNKPIVMEEFGLPRDSELCQPGSPTNMRDKYFNKILTLVYDSSFSGAPIAGTDFWAWSGEGRSRNSDNVWRPGDPFLGDPPQEPQGLNSIFDVDTSTIKILRDNAFKMNSLDHKFLDKDSHELKSNK